MWTDTTWWVHFQKLNLGLACQIAQDVESKSFARWKCKEIPLQNQPNPDQSVFQDLRQKITIPETQTGFRMLFPQGSKDTRSVHTHLHEFGLLGLHFAAVSQTGKLPACAKQMHLWMNGKIKNHTNEKYFGGQ